MMRLSLRSAPLVNTLAIDAIRPKASSSMLRLDASSKAYRMPVSSFSMVVNCFMGRSFLSWHAAAEEVLHLTFILASSLGGFVIAWLGVANTYWIDVISYFVVIGSLLLMVVPRIPFEKRARAGFGALADGRRFLRAHPV